MLHELLLTDRAALVKHEILHYAGLLAGEGDGLPAGAGDAGLCVEGQRAAGEHHVMLGELTQGQAPDARLELCEMKGL